MSEKWRGIQSEEEIWVHGRKRRGGEGDKGMGEDPMRVEKSLIVRWKYRGIG